ncbi:hypothetical protein GJ496_010709 [Pomphorhynchus laevis]|nr:hypothetical protein GJ496_010709 [Pomphorhynchus laevis]
MSGFSGTYAGNWLDSKALSSNMWNPSILNSFYANQPQIPYQSNLMLNQSSVPWNAGIRTHMESFPMRNLYESKRIKSLAHAQYLRYCLLNKITTKVKPTIAQEYRTKWNVILRHTEQALTSVLWKFYSCAFNYSRDSVDPNTYFSLLSTKCRKLAE